MLDYLIASLTPNRLQDRWRHSFKAMQNRNFRLYEFGQLISLAGTWMQNVALSWIVYKLTGSALALGLVQFASNLPLLLLTYFGGVAADRFDKRKLIIVTQYLDMLQALLLTVLFFSGMLNVTWLIILAIYLGCITAFESPARQAFVPELVSAEQLTNAIGLNSAIFNFTRLIGPVLAGFVIAGSRGEAICFILNALSYIGAIVTLHMITPPAKGTAQGHATDHTKKSIGSSEPKPDLKRWITQPTIRSIVLLVAATSLFGFQYNVLLPVIVAENLHGNGSTVGFLSAAQGIGALLGSLFVAVSGIPSRRRIGIAATGLAFAIAILALTHTMIPSMVAVALAGLSISVQLGSSNTFLQHHVPSALRGRVMSIYGLLLMGLGPFSALFAGWCAQSFGLNVALLVSSFGLAICAIAFLVHVSKTK